MTKTKKTSFHYTVEYNEPITFDGKEYFEEEFEVEIKYDIDGDYEIVSVISCLTGSEDLEAFYKAAGDGLGKKISAEVDSLIDDFYTPDYDKYSEHRSFDNYSDYDD